MKRLSVVLILAALAAACGNSLNLIDVFKPDPLPTASPTPAPSPGASPATGLVKPHHVRVAFFGGGCPAGSGQTFPNNGAGEVPVGCTGFATATPKHQDGTDLTPVEHGPGITWALEGGQPYVDITAHRIRRLEELVEALWRGDVMAAAEAGEDVRVWGKASTQEPFNRDVRGVAAGPFSLCATVQGVKGCLDGAVTP